MKSGTCALKVCKCKMGEEKCFMIQTNSGIKTRKISVCGKCKEKIFPNIVEQGEWVYSKRDKLAIFEFFNFSKGRFYFYEETEKV